MAAVIPKLLNTLYLLPPSATLGTIALATVNIRTSGITRLGISSRPERLKLEKELSDGAPDTVGMASCAVITMPPNATITSVINTRIMTTAVCMVKHR